MSRRMGLPVEQVGSGSAVGSFSAQADGDGVTVQRLAGDGSVLTSIRYRVAGVMPAGEVPRLVEALIAGVSAGAVDAAVGAPLTAVTAGVDAGAAAPPAQSRR